MRKTQFKFLYVLFILVLIDCMPSLAQVATGTPPFGSFGGGFHCATCDIRRRGGLTSYI